MKINRSQLQIFTLSFLDVICCALGAVLILFIVIPKYPPTPEGQLNVIQRLQTVVKSLKSENKSLKKEVSQKLIPQPTPDPTPTLFGLPLKANNAVFVIDVSSSMGWQINNLYKTVESLLLSCEVNRFRFVYFDDYIYSSGKYWRHKWMPGTNINKRNILKEAKNFLYELISSPGNTNSGDALYEAIKMRETDVVYFITDGYPTAGETNTDLILSRIRKMNYQKAKINSIMVGLPGTVQGGYGNIVFDPRAKPKKLYEFLHDLAEENGGVYVGR